MTDLYRIVSDIPSDRLTLAQFAPHDLPLRQAVGVAFDIARHLRGTPSVVSADGRALNAEGKSHAALIDAETDMLRKIRAGLVTVMAA